MLFAVRINAFHLRRNTGRGSPIPDITDTKKRTSAKHYALTAEIPGHLQPATQRLDISGQGSDFSRARLGALDSGASFLPDAHSLGDLSLRKAEPDSLLSQSPAAVPGDERSRAYLDLICVAGKELIEKRLHVIERVRRCLRALSRSYLPQNVRGKPDRLAVLLAHCLVTLKHRDQQRGTWRLDAEQDADIAAAWSVRPQLHQARRRPEVSQVGPERISPQLSFNLALDLQELVPGCGRRRGRILARRILVAGISRRGSKCLADHELGLRRGVSGPQALLPGSEPIRPRLRPDRSVSQLSLILDHARQQSP